MGIISDTEISIIGKKQDSSVFRRFYWLGITKLTKKHMKWFIAETFLLVNNSLKFFFLQ